MQIKKAERSKQKARVGLFGPSGSGKTYSALLMASGLTSWDKICVIDTEYGSSQLYTHLGDFSVIEFESPFNPERYITAMNAAVKAGFEVIIIDSISHEWNGTGGVLEIVDATTNKFTSGWKTTTPRHNAFIEAIVRSPAHVICCCRSKQDYEIMENEKGQKVPQKIGLRAITRDSFDYEMTLCFDIDIRHNATSSKDRTSEFDAKPPMVISPQTGVQLLSWLNEGVDAVDPALIADCNEIKAATKALIVSFDLKAPAFKEITGLSFKEIATISHEKDVLEPAYKKLCVWAETQSVDAPKEVA